ncbi:hypothetical protein JN11_02993 [Mucilaginibacter frigoritolerans]|jgi:hypothetical protein|uniref:DUF4163 domain-containing protein n=1 Tax=Mucilaginibacter frigoritolerans TaxID=652788 RepID=A0A562TYX2_9SPHI|nr:hypothetical protein [Mucilaginibacter frigoritolerans]TWI98805.1 hypothetical protein JN11_02993 [Mucilaginibacter frigoritolerans]
MKYLKIIFVVSLNCCFSVFYGHSQGKPSQYIISTQSVALNYKDQSDTLHLPLVSDKYPELKKALSYERIFDGKSLADVVKNYNACGCGVTALNYAVTFENNDVISIELYYETMGAYPDSEEQWFTLNIHTGQLYPVSNEINSAGMKWLFENYKATLKKRIQDNKEDIMNNDDGANIYKELDDAINNLQSDELLKKYVFTEKGIELSIERILPHVVANLEPDDDWIVPYSKLKSFKRTGAAVLK